MEVEAPFSTVSGESSGRGKGTRTPITRIFVDSVLSVGGTLELPQGEAHHVYRVLRGSEGDLLEVVDGEGRLFAAELRGGEAAVLEEMGAEGEDMEVSLYQAVPKGGRMDLLVEKATEVGVTRIVPLLTERGEVRPRGGKLERWRRVAEAAARQSLRLRVPEVWEPEPFDRAVWRAGERGILLHNAVGLAPLDDVVAGPASLFVGPEGGWDDGEMRLAQEAGLCRARLGPYRLRSETAGIVAVARACAALERRPEVAERRSEQS